MGKSSRKLWRGEIFILKSNVCFTIIYTFTLNLNVLETKYTFVVRLTQLISFTQLLCKHQCFGFFIAYYWLLLLLIIWLYQSHAHNLYLTLLEKKKTWSAFSVFLFVLSTRLFEALANSVFSHECYFPLKVAYLTFPANIYLFKVNDRNTRNRCKICSKLTIKTPEQRHWRRYDVFIANFEHISYLFLVFLSLTLNR